MPLFSGDASPFESEEERRAVVSALRVYRNRLRMSARANLRKQWQPAPGRMNVNLAKLRTVNALLARWQVDGDTARPALIGEGDSC